MTMSGEFSYQGSRKPGSWEGKVTISEDFDKLPEDLTKVFQGENE